MIGQMIGLTLAMLAQVAASTPVSSSGVVAAPAAPAKSKMICRKYDMIGSLIQKQKVCRTNEAWGRSDEEQRREAERLRPLISAQAPS